MPELNPPPGGRVVLLAAVDDSERAEAVVAAASSLALSLTGAEVHLAHVVDAVDPAKVIVGGSPLAQPSASVLLDEGRRYVRSRMDQVHARCGGKVRVVGHVAAGPAWREIVQIGIDIDAALVIIGAKPMGALERLLLGSVAQTIVQKSPLPVLVAKAGEARTADFSPACARCLEAQRTSGGRRLLCDEHARSPSRAHVFIDVDEPSGGV